MSNGYLAMWEVVSGKISVLLFTNCLIIKSYYSSMKLTWNDPFRLYLIEKDHSGKWEGLWANERIFESK